MLTVNKFSSHFPPWRFPMAPGGAKWRCHHFCRFQVGASQQNHEAESDSSRRPLGLFFQLQVNVDDALWNVDAVHGDQPTELG